MWRIVSWINSKWRHELWVCVPDKGRFFHELRTDIKQLPSFSYTYVTQNSTASTSEIEQILCSNLNIMSHYEFLDGELWKDHLPIYCELNINYPVEFNFDEPTETDNLKAGIFWDQVTDEQIYLNRNSLEDASIDLLDDVSNIQSVKCGSSFPNTQVRNLYNTLIDAKLILSIYLIKRKKCPEDRIVGWNLHCKHLHSDAGHIFLLWHNNGRLRSGVTFEALKTSRAHFKRAVTF